MRRHVWLIALMAIAAVSLAAAAQVRAQKGTDAEVERVKTLYVAFFDALRRSDEEAIRRFIHPPLLVLDGLEGAEILYASADDFAEEVGDGANYRFDPDLLDVRVMGKVASVRASMTFEAGEQFQPVFADVLAVLDDGEWRLKCAAIGPAAEREEQ
ncbi:MAG: nuclear transport factor 2 family protein [Armatimonadota bacterium]